MLYYLSISEEIKAESISNLFKVTEITSDKKKTENQATWLKRLCTLSYGSETYLIHSEAVDGGHC